MDPIDSRSAIAEEAAHWWARVCSRDPRTVAPADREAFTEWLRASPLNVAELLHISRVHCALQHFRGWSELAREESNASAGNVVPLPHSRPESRRIRSWVAAASITAIGLIIAGLFSGLSGRVIRTAQAERREVVLNDGTVVQLEPETLIKVSLRAHERRIWLERGRALFHVAKDPQRPFWVLADDTAVRAVGTEFGVEERTRGVVVTVAEGKVAVVSSFRAAKSAPRPIPSSAAKNGSIVRGQDVEVFVAAGQQVTVPIDGMTSIPAIRTVDAHRALAWAQGRLVFENDTLADVVAEFNKYNHVQLHLSDPLLATRRVSGVFDATDPDTLLAFILAGSRVHIEREGTAQVYIEPER